MPRQLEVKCGAYILQIVQPMLDNAELIKRQIDKNDAQMENKATQLSELEKKYNDLNLQMKSKETKISELEDVRIEHLNEIIKKNDQFTDFHMEVNEWKENQTRKLEEMQSTHEKEINEKNIEIKKLEGTVTNLQIDNAIHKTKEDTDNKNDQIKKLEEKIAILRIENAVFKSKENSMAVVIKEIRSQMETVIAEQITNKLCEDQNKQIEEYENQLSKQNRQIEELSMQVNSQSRIEEYENQLNNKNNQIKELTMNVNSLSRTVEEYKIELNKQTNPIKKLTSLAQVKEVTSCLPFADSPGVHTIFLRNFEAFKVLCDSDIAGPGWMVIQQENSAFNFNQNWTTFKNGFGIISNKGNFFLGLEKIHRLTLNQKHELYIQWETENRTFYAGYENFTIAGEKDQYRLHLGRRIDGDDIMGDHKNMRFSTYDQDNDESTKECATKFGSGWWYNDCGNW